MPILLKAKTSQVKNSQNIIRTSLVESAPQGIRCVSDVMKLEFMVHILG